MPLLTNIVLVVGNGLDLHLNVKSKLDHFLTTEVFKRAGDQFEYDGSNLLYTLIYLRFFANGEYDYGSFRRVDDNSPLWMDVEGFLKKIATDKNIFNHIRDAYAQVITGLRSFGPLSSEVKNRLASAIAKRNPSKSGADGVINRLLREDLLEFEEAFKNYMIKQIKLDPDYDKKKTDFLKRIVDNIIPTKAIATNLYVYNFNYTSIKGNNINTSNVHGSLEDRIVIGYDSTDTYTNDEIYELSKDWQKTGLKNDTFDIRDFAFSKIVFYGHSLGEQDYPYFFELFDKSELLKNNSMTELYFCYSKFGNEKEQNDFYNNYQISISKLLNAYERYSGDKQKRNTVVTKLKTQKRLHLLEIID